MPSRAVSSILAINLTIPAYQIYKYISQYMSLFGAVSAHLVLTTFTRLAYGTPLLLQVICRAVSLVCPILLSHSAHLLQ